MSELYCAKLHDAIQRNSENFIWGEDALYSGVEGCLRLAREYGYALPDLKDEKLIHDDITSSYSVLCVRAYNLHPPVDAKDWVNAIYEGLAKARK